MGNPLHIHEIGDILKFRYEGGECLYMEVIRLDKGRNNYKVSIIKCDNNYYAKRGERYFNLPRKRTKRISSKELLIGVL